MRYRAVIFDLWETLIDWDREAAGGDACERARDRGDEFHARWSSSTDALHRRRSGRRSPRRASPTR